MAFRFINQGSLKSFYFRRITSCRYGGLELKRLHPVQAVSLCHMRCCFLTDFIPRRCFSMSNNNYLFKKEDKNIDPESQQPYTHGVKGDLVYSGPLTIAVKRLKRLSFFTSFMGLALIPYFIVNKLAWAAIGGFGFFIFGTPCLIHFIFAKNYVTDIYFNDKTKVFHLAKLSFFMWRKEFEFTADDVIIPDLPGAFATYTIKGIPVFINRTLFTSKEVYKHMVGYDKPLDLKMSDSVNLDAPEVEIEEIKELQKKIKSKSEL